MCARPFTATGQAKLRFTRAGRLLGYVDGDGRAELRIQMLGGEDLRPPADQLSRKRKVFLTSEQPEL